MIERKQLRALLYGMVDELAEIEHLRWSHWQRYVHQSAEVQGDGSLRIPAALVERWEKQIATPFASLSEAEKDSDRDEVWRYLQVIVKALVDNAPGE